MKIVREAITHWCFEGEYAKNVYGVVSEARGVVFWACEKHMRELQELKLPSSGPQYFREYQEYDKRWLIFNSELVRSVVSFDATLPNSAELSKEVVDRLNREES